MDGRKKNNGKTTNELLVGASLSFTFPVIHCGVTLAARCYFFFFFFFLPLQRVTNNGCLFTEDEDKGTTRPQVEINEPTYLIVPRNNF